MKYILILISLLIFTACSVEQRIGNHSYTNYWYNENGQRYQVYKTRFGKNYIIVVDKTETYLKRKYIKL